MPVTFWVLFVSCSIQQNIPSVVDETIEDKLRTEAARILAVSEDRDHRSKYQFLLSEFPREDILGMSVGGGRIYVSYKLASGASNDSNHLWLLRQTLAHEIAHETAGHAKQGGLIWSNAGALTVGASGREVGLPWYVRVYNYSAEKELEADLKGLRYWSKLGWDCRIWVRILENLQRQNYAGDRFHPTDRRLQLALSVCQAQKNETPVPRNAPAAENQSSRLVN
jgi:predicted Zn-dependent protease